MHVTSNGAGGYSPYSPPGQMGCSPEINRNFSPKAECLNIGVPS